MNQHTAPHGFVATIGHPANGVLIVKTASDLWRYVDTGKPVHDEDFRAGWDDFDGAVAADGTVLVPPVIKRILEALADDIERVVAKTADNVRERRGDYLADVESLDDYSSQLRLLARDVWGAGTHDVRA